MRISSQLFCSSVCFCVALAIVPSVSDARELQAIRLGKYDYVVMVGTEADQPLYVGETSELDVRIHRFDFDSDPDMHALTPVGEGESAVQIEISAASGELPAVIEPRRPGHYAIAFTPANSGQHTLRIYGRLNGRSFDLNFRCGEPAISLATHANHLVHRGQFDCPQVKPSSLLPRDKTDVEILQSKVAALEGEISRIEYLKAELTIAQRHRMLTMVIALFGVTLSGVSLYLWWDAKRSVTSA